MIISSFERLEADLLSLDTSRMMQVSYKGGLLKNRDNLQLRAESPTISTKLLQEIYIDLD